MFDDDVRAAGGFRQLFELWRSRGMSVEDRVDAAFSEETGIYSELGFRVTRVDVGGGYAELTFPFSHREARQAACARRRHHGGARYDVRPGRDEREHEHGAIDAGAQGELHQAAGEGAVRVAGRVIHAGTNTAVVEGEIRDSGDEVCARPRHVVHIQGVDRTPERLFSAAPMSGCALGWVRFRR
jgi:acyl-coenzyme A thioesterase PaaI-like protein